MNEEYFRDLENFQDAVRRYAGWMKENQTGLMSWWQGLNSLYSEVTKTKAELDLWHYGKKTE